MARWLGITAMLVCCLTRGGPAAASPDAERLFRDGRALATAGDWAAACDRFERSRALEPKVGTLLNLADCREHLGQVATAWALFLDARSLAGRDNDRRRAAEATRRAARLEPHLPYLHLVVPADSAVPGLVITRADVDAPAATWNLASPIDPGDYRIAAAAPGRRGWSTTVHVALGQRVAVDVPRLEAAPADAPPSSAGPSRPAAPIAAARWREYTIAVGAAFGTDLVENAVVGARVVASTPSPRGLVRVVVGAVTQRYEDEPAMFTRAYKVGVGVDYLLTPWPQARVGAGLGLGFDYDVPDGGRPTDLGTWWSVRATPILVRFVGGRVELGLHGQLIRAGDEWQRQALLAGDVFVW